MNKKLIKNKDQLIDFIDLWKILDYEQTVLRKMDTETIIARLFKEYE